MAGARFDQARRAALRLLLLGVPGLSGCAHAGHGAAVTARTGHTEWTEARFPAVGGRRYYHRSEPGRATVVVLHEILGLSAACFRLGDDLWNSGFNVFLPVLFGKPGGHSFLGGYFRSCATGQFACGAANEASAILPSLQAFCEHVAGVCDARRLGVIGMCLTGSFPLWLMRSELVHAPVLCQPSIPFSLVGAGDATALGLSARDLRLAIARGDVPILGMRYTNDWRCPMQRFTRLSELFGARFRAFEIPSGVGGAPDGHSVLVGDRWPAAYDRTVAFLEERLRQGVPRR